MRTPEPVPPGIKIGDRVRGIQWNCHSHNERWIEGVFIGIDNEGDAALEVCPGTPPHFVKPESITAL